ncbi:PKD domain-containing protein [Tunicatimonas pelagia]|uniref:PKD domain-containing protein n=1 Tax=Tunicatimonas pelagia TaxID=931531 RepID=UPI0026655140|nr:PKD domain-containing protein [Tunicatimonas pelagia]WKN43545.1 PKD domain-containing protein [Tunicatimonas pelagia]
MKNFITLGLSISVLFFSCSEEEEATPLVAGFTVEVTGEAPNAQVMITNNSTGASTFSWTFSEGANIATSSEESPTALTLDKAGDFTVKLVVSNGTEEEELTGTVSVAGHNAIITYTDVAFGLNAEDATYGRLFSLETGKIYKDSEMDGTDGSIIHLAFGSLGNTMYFFESPTAEGYNVSNATETKVMNFESTPSISVDNFDAMTDDSLLSGLTIVEMNDSFGNSSIPGTVLFETSAGRKGVIKTKAVNSDRLLVDIKAQKY